ncbi:MAG: hypothetical protein GY943_15160 [Chloroflexi bacterium]|nr:hypothetical protein [Chloroflexota bacterium]
MKKRTTNMGGLYLIFFGGLLLLHTTILPLFGVNTGLWQLWPLLVTGAGMMFVMAPFTTRENRGLGALFIPGFPIVMTSALLLVGSLFHWWNVWATFWPLVVVALSAGFIMNAIYSKNVWLFIPGIIIGVNGLLFQFFAITGWWHLWSVAWTAEPLAVGLALLFTGSLANQSGVFRAGMIVTAVAGVAFGLMTIIFASWAGTVGALLLIVAGGSMLVRRGKAEPTYLPEKEFDFFPTEESIKEKQPEALEI